MSRAEARYDIKAEDKTAPAFDSVKSRFSAATKTFSTAAGIAGAAVTAGFAAVVRQQAAAADEVGNLSTRLGVSTEALSEYQHVAELANVSFGQLSTAWQRQSRRVAEAALGTGEAKKALEELGISAEELNQLAPDKQFEVLATALNGVENSADRVRLAMKFWDSEGVSLLQIVNQGTDAIAAQRMEAIAFGRSLSGEGVAAIQKADTALKRLSGAVKGFANRVAVDAAPIVTNFADVLANVMGPAVSLLIGGFRALGTLIGGSVAAIVQVMDGDLSAAAETVRNTWKDARMAMTDSFEIALGESKSFTSAMVDDATAAGQSFADAFIGPPIEDMDKKHQTQMKQLSSFIKSFVIPDLREAAGGSSFAGVGAQVSRSRFVLNDATTRRQDKTNKKLDEVVNLLKQVELNTARAELIEAGVLA